MKSIACNNFGWKVANQSKDWRIRRRQCKQKFSKSAKIKPEAVYHFFLSCIWNRIVQNVSVRGDHLQGTYTRVSVKSLARPGRKQATAKKLGIYSTYSPRSSIHFLVLCSNFCKPLKKKNQKVVCPTRSPRQQWPPRRTKNGELSIVFFSPGNMW